jgi:hypothetical protein
VTVLSGCEEAPDIGEVVEEQDEIMSWDSNLASGVVGFNDTTSWTRLFGMTLDCGIMWKGSVYVG